MHFRILPGSVLLLLLLPLAAAAQADQQWPPLNYLRSDYRASAIVAHVRVTEAEVANRIVGLEDWRLVCKIIEPFKGKVRKGEQLVYYHGAEAGFREELFLGEKIIFLQRNFYNKEKRWVYAAIENSTLAYNQTRARKLRTIKQSVHRKTPPGKP
ncbi:MAG: hypothetical protein ABR607_07335 [Pyrinomonadaceae bacterium]